jgi:hypothetical protein
LRVEAVDFARIQPVRWCDLARRVRLRVEGLGGAHAQPSPASATLLGGLSPGSALAFPEIIKAIAHLRDVLGDETYESIAGRGEAMTTAAMATYAYDQIDQARIELKGTG